MAVEENKRKRKHLNGVMDDGDGGGAGDNEEVEPRKIAKKCKKSKKSKNHQTIEEENHENKNDVKCDNNVEMDEKEEEDKELCPNNDNGAEGEKSGVNGPEEENVENHDSGFEHEEKEEKPLKFSTDFKMLNFRAKLRGSNFITELRHFLYLSQSRPRVIAKYIEKRGKPLELVEALERVEKSNVVHVAYLCQALQLVVMEILSNQKTHMESALSACRYFLKVHGNVLQLLLKSSNVQHRRTALKLMTAIVCVEPQLGRQLLCSYDILSNVKTIENFLSHSRHELQAEDTVRKCYIHFVLAYLVDGNILLIRNILDRGMLIHALVSGMLYDDHVTVCVILSTLRKYVLECTDISKTKKIHVFDLECCKHFARLYDWRGPKVYAALLRKNGSVDSLKMRSHEVDDLVDPEERQAVATAVHEFLVILLSSRKYGISFDAMTHFREKHNVIQGKTIGCLFKPWCDTLKTELVLKVLKACPDLARHTMRHFGGIVNPMRTAERDWVAACDFLTQIISTLHPRLLKNAVDKITLTDFTYWIKDICLPVEVLTHITGSKTLNHNNYNIRVAANRLLLAMFMQYSNFVALISKREQTRSGGSSSSNSLRRFKFDILNHILVHFPTMESIVCSLYVSIHKKEMEGVNVLEHLEVALDLILIMCRENRSFVNKTSTILDYLEILRPLYANDEQEADNEATEEGTSKKGNIKLELKAIKAILLLFPKALEPHAKLFGNVLKSLIKVFVHGSVEVQREACSLLHGIFKNTGLFDAGELEIDLWLEAMRFYDANTIAVVTSVLIEVLQVTKADVDELKASVDPDMISNSNLQKLFENIEQGLSVEAYIETLRISKLMPLIFKGVEIIEPLRQYLETVCLLMFHYYPAPEQVYQLYTMEFSSLEPYMKSWLRIKDPEAGKLEDPAAACVPKLQELQAAILHGGKKYEEFFAANGVSDELEIVFNGKQQKFTQILSSQHMIMIYSQTILFMVSQLVVKQSFTQKQAESAAGYLKGFITVAQELEKQDLQSADQRTSNNETDQSSLLTELLKYIFSTRISYIAIMEIFDASHASRLHYLQFLSELAECCNELDGFVQFTTNFRLRLVKAVAISMQNLDLTIQQSEKLAPSVRLMQAFHLDAENCVEILNLLTTKLKYKHFFIASSGQRTIYFELLALMLQRLADLKKSLRCDEFMRRFVKLYINFVHKLQVDINLEQLESALHQFLLVSHHYIPQIDGKFFDSFFVERKTSKYTVRLACLMLERDAKLKEKFLELLPLHKGKKELVYPLLKIAFAKKFTIESSLLNSIYQEYKNGFMKTIEKPQKAGVIYKENVESSIALIEFCMPKSECVDFCNKSLKFDVIELYQMRIIYAIYKKAMSSLEETTAAAVKQRQSIFVSYINLQLQMLVVDLKKQSLDRDKLELFAFYLQEWVAKKPLGELPATEDDEVNHSTSPDFTRILKSQQWMNFCKTALKLGMQSNAEIEADPEELQQSDITNGLLLKLLAFLCDQLYNDFEAENEHFDECAAEPAQLFDMIFTHSRFIDIVLQLGSGSPTQVKTEVLHLLYVLACKSPTRALNESQIPVILGAYQARLFDSDRYALALLELYEIHDCNLQKYRPFIWGESATAFYALRATNDTERSKLAQQETSVAQVMSLIDRQVCDYTIDNFPIWRRLHSSLQMPTVHFQDPTQKANCFGSNALEQRIEQQLLQNPGEPIKFTVGELRLCPKRAAVYESCYDPAFFIPLMNMCFAPESYAHPARPVQNGLLAMVFAALSSQDRNLRLAAGCGHLRYRTHFESNKFFERLLWIQFYENIQAGLSELRTTWMKHKHNSGTPRVPFVSGLFVAKSINLTTEPMHLLYKPLTMFLRLKSSFDFQCIPEFNVLFYSAEVEHQQFRKFIIEIIRSGIKCSSDLFLLVSTHTFKVLMGFYGSPLSTLELNLLILSVFSTCVKIPASSKIMIEHVGILPWLMSIVCSLEFYHFDIIEGLITILSNLWYALLANSGEFHNHTHICAELHRLLLSLVPHLSPRISSAGLSKVLNILNKTAKPHQYWAMSPKQLDHLIECCRKHFPDLIGTVEGIRLFGGAGAETSTQYCQHLYALKADTVTILALSSLRSYVSNWWQCCMCQQQITEADTSSASLTLSTSIV